MTSLFAECLCVTLAQRRRAWSSRSASTWRNSLKRTHMTHAVTNPDALSPQMHYKIPYPRAAYVDHTRYRSHRLTRPFFRPFDASAVPGKTDRDGSSVSVCCFETLSLMFLPPLASFVCWRVECVTTHLAQLHAQLRQAAAFQIARGRVRACRFRCANFVAASANHLCFVSTVHMRHCSRRIVFNLPPAPFSSRKQRMAILQTPTTYKVQLSLRPIPGNNDKQSK